MAKREARHEHHRNLSRQHATQAAPGPPATVPAHGNPIKAGNAHDPVRIVAGARVQFVEAARGSRPGPGACVANYPSRKTWSMSCKRMSLTSGHGLRGRQLASTKAPLPTESQRLVGRRVGAGTSIVPMSSLPVFRNVTRISAIDAAVSAAAAAASVASLLPREDGVVPELRDDRNSQIRVVLPIALWRLRDLPPRCSSARRATGRGT